MKPFQPIRVGTITIPAVFCGKWVYFVDHHGVGISQRIKRSRLGPLTEECQRSLLWKQVALASLNRLKANAAHFRHRGPWEAKAFAMKMHFRERATASMLRRPRRKARKLRPTTWHPAASDMIARIYYKVYRVRPGSEWERWAHCKISTGHGRSYRCQNHPV